jgi:translation initiation factor IF-3
LTFPGHPVFLRTQLEAGEVIPPPFGPRIREGTAGFRRSDQGPAFVTPFSPGHTGLFFRPEYLSAGDSANNRAEVLTIKEQKVRVNDQIRISPIRLISDEGEQIGIVSIDEARSRAEEVGLDLVEVAPDARPPVVKLMDYGKFKYEQARAAREARKKQHTIQVKEVKFRPGIEEHDYEFKTRHARKFLEEGNKVRLTMMFRGRQITHSELGLEVLERVKEDLSDIGKVESEPSFEGRVMFMVMAPLKTK